MPVKELMNQGALLFAGMLCALLAWCFWHFLGQDAFEVFTLLFMLTLLAENFLLKKELRKVKGKDNQHAGESA